MTSREPGTSSLAKISTRAAEQRAAERQPITTVWPWREEASKSQVGEHADGTVEATPWRASSTATSRPMPLLAPVTSATTGAVGETAGGLRTPPSTLCLRAPRAVAASASATDGRLTESRESETQVAIIKPSRACGGSPASLSAGSKMRPSTALKVKATASGSGSAKRIAVPVHENCAAAIRCCRKSSRAAARANLASMRV
mmetsp:Transcript_3232/g.10268  ORF Transcript_3232/g.10268 Transcript_3232/m.10268 type:complete len:201 (-) Transcript_3232:10-612(-)